MDERRCHQCYVCVCVCPSCIWFHQFFFFCCYLSDLALALLCFAPTVWCFRVKCFSNFQTYRHKIKHRFLSIPILLCVATVCFMCSIALRPCFSLVWFGSVWFGDLVLLFETKQALADDFVRWRTFYTESKASSIEITWKIEPADEFLMTDYLYAHNHTHNHWMANIAECRTKTETMAYTPNRRKQQQQQQKLENTESNSTKEWHRVSERKKNAMHWQ